MAVPLLDFVTGRARQALPFLKKAASEGLTPTQAISQLRELGGGGQTQRLLDIYAALQNRISLPRILRLVGETTTIPKDLHHLAETTINSNYQYVIATSVGGYPTPDFLTVTSSVPLSAAQIRAQGAFLFNSEEYSDLDLGPVEQSDIDITEANVADYAP